MGAGRLAAGTSLGGKYRIDACLGAGGMGEVYRATNTTIDRIVAVKVLHPEHAANPDVVRRFLQEARAANRVRHPNVVDVLDVNEDPASGPFIVQEFLDGQDLDSVLSELKGQVSFDAAMRIVIPIIEAIGQGHKQGVVHRDIKPANVFLSRIGGRTTPKVLDFGIAHIVGEDPTMQRMTSTGVAMGTPAYMAPEVVQGGSRAADPRSDVWSLGVMLFEILAGKLPFNAETLSGLFVAICTETATPLASCVAGLPPELYVVVDRCLKKSPTERYPSAALLAEELRGLWQKYADPSGPSNKEKAFEGTLASARQRASQRPPPANAQGAVITTEPEVRMYAASVEDQGIAGLASPKVPRELSREAVSGQIAAVAARAPAGIAEPRAAPKVVPTAATERPPVTGEGPVIGTLVTAPKAGRASGAGASPARAAAAVARPSAPQDQSPFSDFDSPLDQGSAGLELDVHGGAGVSPVVVAAAAARSSRTSLAQEARVSSPRARVSRPIERPVQRGPWREVTQVLSMLGGLVAAGFGAQLAGSAGSGMTAELGTAAPTAVGAIAVAMAVAGVVLLMSSVQMGSAFGAIAAGVGLIGCAVLVGLRAAVLGGVEGLPDLGAHSASWALALVGAGIALVASARARETHASADSGVLPLLFGVVGVAGIAVLIQSIILATR